MFPFPALPFPSREEGRGKDEDGWEGTGDMRDRGKRRGGTCGPKVQKDRMQVWAEAVFGWHLFWVFCRAGPSPGVKSCLSDHNRGNVGKGGRWGGGARESGQTGTYTTDVCSEKYRKIVMQI